MAERTWTQFDDGLLRAAWIAERADSGRLHELDAVPSPFATTHPGDRVLAASPYELSTWCAPGDGSYHHSGAFLLATGRRGLALTAAVAAGVASGNARRRRQAALDAVPRWLATDRGTLWVGTHGFRLQNTVGLAFWAWQYVDAVRCLGQGSVEVQGRSASGPASIRILAPSAESLFVLWVHARGALTHPDWVARTWLRDDWLAWAHHLGCPVPDPAWRVLPSPDPQT